MRKCPGVNASKSSGSLLSGVSGLEFKTASAWVKIVAISSYRSVRVPIVRLNSSLNYLTADSHSPPKFGDRAGMKRNSICSSLACLTTSDWNC